MDLGNVWNPDIGFVDGGHPSLYSFPMSDLGSNELSNDESERSPEVVARTLTRAEFEVDIV